MSFSYKKAGVDIQAADAAKTMMKKDLATNDKRVLNTVGAFASLFDARFPDMEHPVLVLKTEEPGTKQKLAIEHGRIESLCEDMIHHLINDIVVMGATPLSVQDAIICGKLERETVNRLVKGIAAACRAQGCVLTGGETSEQPGVLEPGTYVLTASIVGVVDKSEIIDGRAIRTGDTVIAVASNGLHTNGYSLVRALLRQEPALAGETIGGRTFLDAILEPHTCYYQSLKGLFSLRGLHGMAHITGGGMAGNLNRILPKGTAAAIDLGKIRALPVFHFIREHARVSDADMLQTYNLGVGLTIVADPQEQTKIIAHLKKHGHAAYPIGTIVRGGRKVSFAGALRWKD
ncbi:MAG: phosphoribosylformylglycinamidine cyclo-ligase [Candidatus Peregrinibacteria bacterium Greene0416_19]|nr:MAG: phosphoribosylformylglycinamidine cyclo-ligase [Candidatus Peregrinibacteria bacterium Greene0416_19]